MRTHALLVGGGLAVSLLLPPTSAQAFFLNLDQLFTRQTPAKQAHRRQAHPSGVGHGDRTHTLQAAFGRQDESRNSTGSSAAATSRTRQVVDFPTWHSSGSIVIKTSERRLYYVLGGGKAVRYPVGVGRAGMQWEGTTTISGKYIKPAWSPPAMIKRENPRIPNVIPSGSPSNPMGAAAMTLRGREDAIHGTNRPGSVGGFVSHGCIRMRNADVLDLYARVSVGTPVIVVR